MSTFSITRPESLLANMVRSLLIETSPGTVVAPESEGRAPDWGGIRVTDTSSRRWFCVFPSTHSPHDLSLALSAGASAVLTIEDGHLDFTRALDAVATGQTAFVPFAVIRWMANESVAERRERGRGAQVRLTAREREVLELVASGHSNGEIAEALTISTNTVRSHMHALSVKLNATSRIRMVRNAGSLGLLEVVSPSRTGLRYDGLSA